MPRRSLLAHPLAGLMWVGLILLAFTLRLVSAAPTAGHPYFDLQWAADQPAVQRIFAAWSIDRRPASLLTQLALDVAFAWGVAGFTLSVLERLHKRRWLSGVALAIVVGQAVETAVVISLLVLPGRDFPVPFERLALEVTAPPLLLLLLWVGVGVKWLGYVVVLFEGMRRSKQVSLWSKRITRRLPSRSTVSTVPPWRWVWPALVAAVRAPLPPVLLGLLGFAVAHGVLGVDELFTVDRPLVAILNGCLLVTFIGFYARSVVLMQLLQGDLLPEFFGVLRGQEDQGPRPRPEPFVVLLLLLGGGMQAAFLIGTDWSTFLYYGIGGCVGVVVSLGIFFLWRATPRTSADGGGGDTADELLVRRDERRSMQRRAERLRGLEEVSVQLDDSYLERLTVRHRVSLLVEGLSQLGLLVLAYTELLPATAVVIVGLFCLAVAYMHLRGRFPTSVLPAVGLVLLIGMSTTLGERAEFSSLWPEVEDLRSAPRPPPPRLEPCAKLAAWEANRARGDADPLIVVGVSGGGIRAAGWALDVLLHFEQLFPEAVDNIQVVAGASGGIVGATEWVASLEVDPDHGRVVSDRVAGERFIDEVRTRALNRVTPVLMFPWLFEPFGIDRGERLEETFVEASWSERAPPGGWMARTLSELRPGEARGWRPSLVYTPMQVETGRPLLISNLAFPSTVRFETADVAFERRVHTDFLAEYQSLYARPLDEVRVATFARMSASFPVVSPAARLGAQPPPEPRDYAPYEEAALSRWDRHPIRHVVDAGYFDNYGGYGAAKYLAAIESCDSATPKRPVVVVLVDAFDDHGAMANAAAPCGPRDGHTETVTSRMFSFLHQPLQGAAEARQAKNRLYNALLLESASLRKARPVHVLELGYGGGGPLSWSMITHDRDQMKAWLPSGARPAGVAASDLTCVELARVQRCCAGGSDLACDGVGDAGAGRRLRVHGGWYNCGRDEIARTFCALSGLLDDPSPGFCPISAPSERPVEPPPR